MQTQPLWHLPVEGFACTWVGFKQVQKLVLDAWLERYKRYEASEVRYIWKYVNWQRNLEKEHTNRHEC